MRIALIRPGLGHLGRRRYRSLACLEPKALALLAGLTPLDVHVAAYDDRFEHLPYDEPWDLVALSVGTFQARRAYEIAARFRARGIKVVMGGYHPSLCPDEVAQHADAVAVGEAEALWPTIVEDARSGRLQPRYVQKEPPALGGVLPRASILRGKRYLPMSVIQYGRGCRYNCDFCSIKAFYPGALRYRPVDDVLAEISDAGRRWVFFADDNLVSDRERAKALFLALRPHTLRWSSQVSLDFLDDSELVDAMVESGCQSVVVGLESLDPRNMRQMGKGWSPSAEYAARLAAIRARGIMVYATFVFGYDEDDEEAFERTLDFAMQQKLFLANFNHLQPYPGTRLYERLEREGRLLYRRWWLDPRYRFGEAVFHPRKMSARQLTEGAFRARSRFNRWSAIGRRLWERDANLANLSNALTFLLANVASRQDIHRKQGLSLGLGKEQGGALRRALRAQFHAPLHLPGGQR